jgi:tetratricopeptide (TPR) repeat protein
VDNSSDREALLLGHTGVELTRIYLNNDPDDSQGTTVADALIAEFNDVPRVDWCVFVIADEYYKKGSAMRNQGLEPLADKNFLKAINVWQRIEDNFKESKHIAEVWYFLGVTYQHLKDYQKATMYFEEVAKGGPDYYRRWDALSSLAFLYEEQWRMNKLSKKAATSKIKKVYQEIIQKYPDAPSAGAANAWLQEN